MSKVLWITLEDGNSGEAEDLANQMDELLGDEYEPVVSSPDIELLSKDEILEALQGDDDE